LGYSGNLYATATEVINSQGDLRRGDSSGNPERLAIGSSGKVLQSNGTTESWETLTTADSVLTTQGDILVEGASGLERLGQSTDGFLLTTKGAGANPVWAASTATGQLVKVTKSYTDVSSLELPIYTLPADQALTNVYTDITTTWDVGSTAVTIGDSSDPNGFQEATDWSSSTGLSSATRGAYVSANKGMRSTSSTTAIVGYGFASGGTTFLQNDEDGSEDLYPATNRTQVGQMFLTGQVLVGEDVTKASFWIRDNVGGATGTIRAYIRESDGTLITTNTPATDVDASTLTGSFVEHSFTFASTTIDADDMIMLSSASVGGNVIQVQRDAGDLTDGEVWEQSFGTYAQKTNLKMRMSVTYAVTSLTQGAVDFYLQIAKE